MSSTPALEFITRPAFAVLGLESAGPADRAPEWIAPLWQQAAARRSEIAALITGPAWGLMSAVDAWLQPWTDRGRYLAGWEIDPLLPAPNGWAVWQIPASTFARIPCTLATYGAALTRLREMLVVDPHHAQAGAVHEFYPFPFTNPAIDSFYLCAATRPRSR